MDDLFGSNNNNNNNNNEGGSYGNNGYGGNTGNDGSNGYSGSNNYYGGYGSGGDNYKRDNFGLYNDNSYNMSPQNPQSLKPEKKKGIGFALTALIIAVVNLIICKSVISIITVPLCLVFAIISLAGKRKGKAMAVISIVLSVVSAVIFGFYMYIAVKVMPDMMYFMENSETITEEFEKDGTIPERFEKYRDPKFDKYWKKSGYKDFDSFFADFVKSYKDGYSYGYNFASGGSGSGSDFSSSSGGHTNLALIV